MKRISGEVRRPLARASERARQEYIQLPRGLYSGQRKDEGGTNVKGRRMKMADIEVDGWVRVRWSAPRLFGWPGARGWHKVRVIEKRPHGRLLVGEDQWTWDKPMTDPDKMAICRRIDYEVASRSVRPCEE